jgi:pantoate--beta-alanine ligase
VDVNIRVMPTVRDSDGVALSSRNARLSAEERQRARAIPQALSAGAAAYRQGGDPVAAARRELQGLDTDYVAVANLNGLRALVVAARVGGTRLIDNLPLDDAASSGQTL